MGYWLWGIDLHRKLLFDTLRNKAFHRAFQKTIKPGSSVVVDIGSGTGFLSFLCSKLEAKKCILIEADQEIALISKQLAEHNNIKNCTWVNKHSTKIKTGKYEGDIVVSETLGCFAFEENLIENMNEGKRFLKKGGILIPGKVKQFVAPVIASRPLKMFDQWKDVGFDLDFSPMKNLVTSVLTQQRIMPEELLQGNSAICWDSIDFNASPDPIPSGRKSEPIVWTVPGGGDSTTVVSTKAAKSQAPQSKTKSKASKKGGFQQVMAQTPSPVVKKQTTTSPILQVHGFCLWWSSELVPGVELTTSPYEPETHWQQAFLPLVEPFQCLPKDQIQLELHSFSDFDFGLQLNWNISHLRDNEVIDFHTNAENQLPIADMDLD